MIQKGQSGKNSKAFRFINVLILMIICFLWHILSVNSTEGVYSSTEHGISVQRIVGEPNGDCVHCHSEHGSNDGVAIPGGPYDYLLFSENDNNLCYTCHNSAGSATNYQGATIYNASSHATQSNVYWPGTDPPARPSSDKGKCLNCHTPHGYKDTSGLIPSLTFSREENLCLNCHDGSPASNVKSDITKTYRHPAGDFINKHNQTEGGTSTNYGNTNRHAECVDCHNSHYAKSDTSLNAPNASNRIKGVGGVDVLNGAAGTAPSYSYISASVDILYEYQLCFKCHSSWTTQPVGQSDTAMQFNPNNPSYHPVEAIGKNTNINAGAFVNGWTSSSRVHCSDCHSSDNVSDRGPHGSQYKYILNKNYYTSRSHTTTSSEICFNCHNYNTYAVNNNANSYSRFGRHISHVVEERISCYNCHGSHASTNKPHLIVTGRTPGISSYTETTGGGSCSAGGEASGCHGNESYTVRYAR